jgi:hypothetical protein
MNQQLKPPPEKDFADNLHEYFREISKILCGGFVNPLIDIIMPSFHQKQFEKWCSDLYFKIIELERLKLSKNDLRNDLEFISILKECMIIASKNHQAEKLELLKRAIINSIDSDLAFDLKIYFSKLLDSLSVSHILVLRLVNQNIDKIAFLDEFEIIKANLGHELELLKLTDEYLYALFHDLAKFNLIEMSDNIEFNKGVRDMDLIIFSDGDKDLPYLRVTNHGKGFLQYIENK